MTAKHEDRRAHSSHAGRHISPSANPLPKGQACSTCKARKVKCNAGAPACDACKRTAKFEGRDPDLVVCQYGVKAQAGVKRKRPSRPKRKISYASDDDYEPSDESVSLRSGSSSSSSKSRKVRSDSDASTASSSSTPSLAASSSSWASASTLVDNSEPATLALEPVAINSHTRSMPMFASTFSSSPLEASWSAPLEISKPMPAPTPLDYFSYTSPTMSSSASYAEADNSPPSSAPLTPPPLAFALPDMQTPMFGRMTPAFKEQSSSTAWPSTQAAFEFGAALDDAFAFTSLSLPESNLQASAKYQDTSSLQYPIVGSSAPLATPLLAMTPSLMSDSMLPVWTPFDYFSQQQQQQ